MNDLNHDRAFLVKTIVAMVIMVAAITGLLAMGGCDSAEEISREQPIAVQRVRADGSCFMVFKARSAVNGGISIAAVHYPCPVAREELLDETSVPLARY